VPLQGGTLANHDQGWVSKKQKHSGADRADVTCFAVIMLYVYTVTYSSYYTVTFNTVCSADAGSSHSVKLPLSIAPNNTQSQLVTHAVVTLTGCQAKRCSVQVSAYMCISSGMLLRSVYKQQSPQHSASKLLQQLCHIAVTTLAVHSDLEGQLHQGPGSCHTAF